jgi:hypothetical protein
VSFEVQNRVYGVKIDFGKLLGETHMVSHYNNFTLLSPQTHTTDRTSPSRLVELRARLQGSVVYYYTTLVSVDARMLVCLYVYMRACLYASVLACFMSYAAQEPGVCPSCARLSL